MQASSRLELLTREVFRVVNKNINVKSVLSPARRSITNSSRHFSLRSPVGQLDLGPLARLTTRSNTVGMAVGCIRSFAVTGRKSKNVAGKKNKLDALKTKLYNRLGVKIIMAAKAGGPDPGTNKDLARALKEAHTAKLPKDNIERALKKSSDLQAEDYKVGVYEVFGHGGVGILVVSLTDNTNRANNSIKAAARKAEVKMASSGSVLFSFDHKGVLRVKSAFLEDDIIELALEIGADNVDFLELEDSSSSAEDSQAADALPVNLKAIVVDPEYLAAMQDAVGSKLGVPITGNLEYLPSSTVSISDEDYQRNMDLIEIFEDIDDVDKVYHNIEDVS